MDRPRTKTPFTHPCLTNSSASILLKAPQLCIMSTKLTAMQPSTFHLLDSKSKLEDCIAGKVLRSIAIAWWFPHACRGFDTTIYAHDTLVLLSHILHKLLDINTSERQKQASVERMEAASSRSPPNRGSIVRNSLAREETRSLPARAMTTVLWAPEMARPCVIAWSAVTMRNHFDKLCTVASVCWKLMTKPNKRKDATNAELLFKDFTNGHA
jgi:hypothetical protein